MTDTADCGCTTTAVERNMHTIKCPDWINIGPNLAQRQYIRRDNSLTDTATHNTLTGSLTGHEIEKRVRTIVNRGDEASQILRDLIRAYATMRDAAYTDSELDAAASMVKLAIVASRHGYTNQDVNRLMRKLEMAYRNGMWS